MDGEENEEQVVSISEYMEQMEAQQLEADLVLGVDDGNECTYEKGYMKRQAVFSCLTCTKTENAGFCTACCLVCHDGHEVVELWTRRSFRCDCGNEKFGSVECKLNKEKEVQNKGNVYNQNFQGLYCTCHRPYPDPEGVEQGEMLQCCICEDWFHDGHLGLPSSEQVPRDDDGEPAFDELICASCVATCSFLSDYQDILVPTQECGEEDPPSSDGLEPSCSAASKADSDEPAPEPSLHVVISGDCAEASGSNGNSNKSTAENGSTKDKVQTSGKENGATASGESSNGRIIRCKLKPSFHGGESQPQATDGVSTSQGVDTVGSKRLRPGQAVFVAKSWRAELCRCDACLAMYTAKGLSFLLDREDTLQDYEEKAKRKREEYQGKQEETTQDFMKKLGHVQKIELFHGINDMATEFQSFLAPFSREGRTVCKEDISEFFEKLEQKKRRRLNHN